MDTGGGPLREAGSSPLTSKLPPCFRSSTASIPHTPLSLYEAVNLSKIVARIPCDNSTFTKAACGQWASLYQCVCVGRVYLACSQAFDDGSRYMRTDHEEGHSSQPEILTNMGWEGAPTHPDQSTRHTVTYH